MRMLSTLHPFGLNDNVSSLNINLKHYDFIKFNCDNTPFFSFGDYCKRPFRSHGHRKCNKSNFDDDDITAFVRDIVEKYNSHDMHIIYVMLRAKSKQFLRTAIDHVLANKCSGGSTYRQFIIPFNILYGYFSQYVKSSHTNRDKKIFCIIPFPHRIIEHINFNRIIHDKKVRAFLPNIVR